MKLIGYIKIDFDLYFAIPVYTDNDKFYFHELDHHFIIQEFHHIEYIDNVYVDKKISQHYEKNDVGPLILIHKRRAVAGVANLIVYQILEFNQRLKSDLIKDELASISDQLNIDLEFKIAVENIKLISQILRERNSDEQVNSEGGVLVADEDLVEFKLDYDKLRFAVLILRSINHKLRMKIIQVIDNLGYDITFAGLCTIIKLEKDTLSAHLAILVRSQILAVNKKGRFNLYQIDYEMIRRVIVVIELLAENTDHNILR